MFDNAYQTHSGYVMVSVNVVFPLLSFMFFPCSHVNEDLPRVGACDFFPCCSSHPAMLRGLWEEQVSLESGRDSVVFIMETGM